MTAHAIAEMAEDGLDIIDMESAVLHGHITRIEREDPRGTTYVIEGWASDQRTPVRVVGRFTGTGRYSIMTIYAIHGVEEDM